MKSFLTQVKENAQRLLEDVSSITTDRDVTLAEYDMIFNSLAGKKKDSLPFGMRLVDRKLYIYEIPTRLHQAVVQAFTSDVMSSNLTLSGSLDDPFTVLHSPTLRFNNGAMEPD